MWYLGPRCRLVWLLSTYFFALGSSAKAPRGGGGDVLDLFGGVSGTYTHVVDDDLSVTLSYDLQDDSNLPLSVLTGVSVTKAQDLYRQENPSVPIARLILTGSAATKKRIPSGGFTIETNNRTLGMNVNHASRRAQFRFGRSFLEGRFRVALSPLLTYGALRRRRVNFGSWVPAYSPLLSDAGMPRMSLQQRSVVWDWAQGMPQRSPLHGLGVSLRVHTGRRAYISTTLFDGSDRSRLWSLRAEVPVAKPSDVLFSVERTWQIQTTTEMR